MKRKIPTVTSLAKNWQTCHQDDLPKAFYAYDETEKQSERLVTFRLKGKKKINALLDRIIDPQNFQFIVHLGLRPERMAEGGIPDDPAFALFIQVYNGEGDWHQHCLELDWQKNSRFSNLKEGDPYSGKNAIPAASAYLFVHSWLEMAADDLARPFTAATRVMGERVKAYIFSPAESNSIFLDLENSEENCLNIHLGNGNAVWVHPFSFRPIIEVKAAVDKEKPRATPAEATGQSNDDGDSFYDFSYPDPPGEPD